MKIDVKKLIVLFLALCVCATPVFIIAKTQTNVDVDYSGSPEFESFLSMSTEELLLKLDSLSLGNGGGDPDDLIYAAAALREKSGEFSDRQVISILKDANYSVITKITVIQFSEYFNNGQGINDEAEYLKLLMDESVDTAIRMNLINAISFNNKEDRRVLEDLIKADDGNVILLAMKKLSNIDFDSAVRISDAVLENHKTNNPDILRAAVKVKSQFFRESQKNNLINDSEKRRYIDLCMELYEASYDNVFKDTMIFSLSEMKDYEAIKAIILDDSVELKMFCIDQNYSTLKKMFENNADPSEEDIDVLIKAMGICPLVELRPLLENISPKSSQQKNELADVLSKIDQDGIHANEKWFDF